MSFKRSPREPPSERRVVLAGPMPPPTNGMSQAFAFAAAGLTEAYWKVVVLDMADRSPPRRRGQATAARTLASVKCLLRSAVPIAKSDLLYLTVAQSVLGFLKDAPMIWWAWVCGTRTILHLHGGNFSNVVNNRGPLLRAFIRATLERVSRFIVLSAPLSDQFSLLPDACSRTRVVPNACELPRHEPRPAPGNPFRILFLSNMQAEKGYIDLLHALPLFAAHLPGVRIEAHFAGEFALGGRYSSIAAMEREFATLRSQLPHSVAVSWHGMVSGERKLALFRDSDVFVLPTHLNEGQPISIIEAMTSALPVIATDCPGIRDLLSGTPRFLLPSPDARSIAEALLALARDGDLYTATSAALVRDSVRFDPERHIAQLDRVLREALCS